MTPPEINPMLTPIVQYGFAGICAVLLGMQFWLMRVVVEVVKRNTVAITKNTNALLQVTERVNENREVMQQVRDRMISGRCPYGDLKVEKPKSGGQ